MQEEHLVKGPWYFNLHVCEKITLLTTLIAFLRTLQTRHCSESVLRLVCCLSH